MSALKVGDSFPQDVSFTWIAPSPENSEFSACGIPQKYNASESMLQQKAIAIGAHTNQRTTTIVAKDKKIVIVAVPGAFTPTCSANHVPGFIAKAEELKSKGIDQVVFIAHNDAYVMSGWGKANKINDEFIVRFNVPSPAATSLFWALEMCQGKPNTANHCISLYTDLRFR